VVRTVAVLSIDETIGENATVLAAKRQRLVPVVDEEQRLVGIATQSVIRRSLEAIQAGVGAIAVRDVIQSDPIVAYDDEPLRMVVDRMAETGLTRLPVVRRDGGSSA
jgi:chloride channel protein, CIC family